MGKKSEKNPNNNIVLLIQLQFRIRLLVPVLRHCVTFLSNSINLQITKCIIFSTKISTTVSSKREILGIIKTRNSRHPEKIRTLDVKFYGIMINTHESVVVPYSSPIFPQF